MSFTPTIFWVDEEKTQTEEPPTRWSNFWILINSNKAGSTLSERSYLVTRMRQAVNETFSDRNNIIQILQFVDDDGNIIRDLVTKTQMAAQIEKVDTEAVVEIGPRIHRVHSHILFMVQHKTKIQIDVQALRDSIRNKSWLEGSGHLFTNPVVRVKFIKENPINAIRKYQRGYKHKLPASLMRKVITGNPQPSN